MLVDNRIPRCNVNDAAIKYSPCSYSASRLFGVSQAMIGLTQPFNRNRLSTSLIINRLYWSEWKLQCHYDLLGRPKPVWSDVKLWQKMDKNRNHLNLSLDVRGRMSTAFRWFLIMLAWEKKLWGCRFDFGIRGIRHSSVFLCITIWNLRYNYLTVLYLHFNRVIEEVKICISHQ